MSKPPRLERTTDERAIERPAKRGARAIGERVNVGKPWKVTPAKTPKPPKGAPLHEPTLAELQRGFLAHMQTDLHASSGAPLLSERLAKEGLPKPKGKRR